MFIIFLGGGGLPILLNIGTESPRRRRLPISRRLIRRLPEVFLNISPKIDGIPLVNTFKDLGTCVEHVLFGEFRILRLILGLLDLGNFSIPLSSYVLIKPHTKQVPIPLSDIDTGIRIDYI